MSPSFNLLYLFPSTLMLHHKPTSPHQSVKLFWQQQQQKSLKHNFLVQCIIPIVLHALPLSFHFVSFPLHRGPSLYTDSRYSPLSPTPYRPLTCMHSIPRLTLIRSALPISIAIVRSGEGHGEGSIGSGCLFSKCSRWARFLGLQSGWPLGLVISACLIFFWQC